MEGYALLRTALHFPKFCAESGHCREEVVMSSAREDGPVLGWKFPLLTQGGNIAVELYRAIALLEI